MLADPRARAFSEQFAGQWLGTVMEAQALESLALNGGMARFYGKVRSLSVALLHFKGSNLKNRVPILHRSTDLEVPVGKHLKLVVLHGEPNLASAIHTPTALQLESQFGDVGIDLGRKVGNDQSANHLPPRNSATRSGWPRVALWLNA